MICLLFLALPAALLYCGMVQLASGFWGNLAMFGAYFLATWVVRAMIRNLVIHVRIRRRFLRGNIDLADTEVAFERAKRQANVNPHYSPAPLT